MAAESSCGAVGQDLLEVDLLAGSRRSGRRRIHPVTSQRVGAAGRAGGAGLWSFWRSCRDSCCRSSSRLLEPESSKIRFVIVLGYGSLPVALVDSSSEDGRGEGIDVAEDLIAGCRTLLICGVSVQMQHPDQPDRPGERQR